MIRFESWMFEGRLSRWFLAKWHGGDWRPLFQAGHLFRAPFSLIDWSWTGLAEFLPSRCKDGCTRCTSWEVATECGPLHYLTPDHKCSKTCPDGFYADGEPSSIGGVCTKCVEPCTLCKSAERLRMSLPFHVRTKPSSPDPTVPQ